MARRLSYVRAAGDKMLQPLSVDAMRCLLLVLVVLLCGVRSVNSASEGEIVRVLCPFGKPCVLPCHSQEALTKIVWQLHQISPPIDWLPRSEVFKIRNPKFVNRTTLNEDGLQSGNCSMTIKDMKPEDNGGYKCWLWDASKHELDPRYFNVTVYAPVQKVSLVRSGDLWICSSEGVLPEPQCLWSQPSSNSNSTTHDDHQGLFSINCTTPYVPQITCTVSTMFSNKSASYIDLAPRNISDAEMTLSCGNSSAPVESVKWMFNNSEVIVNQSRRDQRWWATKRWKPFVNLLESGDLTLQKLTSDHQGLFTCVLVTDTETFTVNTQLKANGFADLTKACATLISIILAIITTLSTAFAFGAYKYSKDPSAPQQPQESPPDSSSSPGAPPESDCFHIVRIICGLLGLVSVSPWHFLAMPLLYLQHRMNVIDQNWTYSLIVVTSQIPQLPVVLLLNRCFVPRFTHRQYSTVCLIGITLMFSVALVTMSVQMAREVSFGVSLCALGLASTFSAMVQHHLSEELNWLPPKYILSFAHGQEFAGIVASVLMIFCAIFEDVKSCVLWYLAIASLASLITVSSYRCLPCLSFVKHYFNKQRQISKDKECSVSLIDKKNHDNQENMSSDSKAQSLMKTMQIGSVFAVQLVTFLMYPAFVVNVHTTYPGAWGRFFNPVCCFSIFNLINLLLYYKMPFASWASKHFRFVFPILLLFHIVFIEGFIFYSVHQRIFPPLLFDAVFALFMVIFSFFHGFLMRLTMFHVPHSEEKAADDQPKINGGHYWDLLGLSGSVAGALLSFV